ncbi:hypothetical protein GZH46_01647 [Fragariocoptes setiger]|uniref:Uncharacterized protein n=1 Tax=Fragariocoptes setiger TaxID=1670756 RepID=A0ABQ7S8V7_9ACAR|nr:hypothetical protein GZH46_01647 [Fragariocoptes setiger]
MDTKSMMQVDVNGSSSLLSTTDIATQQRNMSHRQPMDDNQSPTVHLGDDDQAMKAKSEDAKVILVYILIVVNVFFSVFNAILIYWVVDTISRTILGQSSQIDIQGSDGKIIIHGQIIFTDNLNTPSLRTKAIDGNNTSGHRLVLSSRSNVTIGLSESSYNSSQESRQSNTDQRHTHENPSHESLRHLYHHHPIVSLIQESIVINSSSIIVKHPDNNASSIDIKKSDITIRSPQLMITEKRGLDAGHLSFMTPRVSSNDANDGVDFHSPTRALKMISPQTMSFNSGESIHIKSIEQLSIESTDGSIVLEASLVDTSYLDTITPSKTGSTYSGIYQLCQCVLRANVNQRQIDELDVIARASLMERKGAIFATNPRLKCNDFDWYCSSL